MLDSLKGFWMRRGRVVLILLFLIAVIFLTQLLTRSGPGATAADLKPFSLAGYHRLLILAPHCDDETLSSAGIIMAAERAGIQVRVVIATNGDGFFFATAQDFRKIYPSSSDYIRMGEVRQQESLAALKILGLQAEQVTFLSYPDRGTPSEWNDHWSAKKPYRSPYSRDSKSPYPITYNPNSVYAGEDYLADLMSILNSYRPDLIIYPHPDDVHPDHWGLNVFARLAIAEVTHADTTFQPTQLTYLIHRPDFPTIRGLKPQENLAPPPALFALNPNWYRWDLTPADIQRKEKAVQAYRTQLPLLHGLMDSFVRTNELFAPVDNPVLQVVAKGNPLDSSTWTDANGQAIQPVERDPVGDFFTRKAVPGGDLVAAYLARGTSNNLWVCTQAREKDVAVLTYRLRLKALDAKGILSYAARTGAQQSGWKQATRSGVYSCAQVSLAELGNPWAVFVGTGVEGGGRLMDQTGWQMVSINSVP
ncbi:MAG: PIG-L family deacetylase [Anaerolineales bacterium]|jgi:LmbE family N-acetylglucosaminyl deacetylase